MLNFSHQRNGNYVGNYHFTLKSLAKMKNTDFIKSVENVEKLKLYAPLMQPFRRTIQCVVDLHVHTL